MKLYSELFCTYSMEEKNRVIHILEEHQIPYKISTNGNTMRNLGSRGMALDQFGEKPPEDRHHARPQPQQRGHAVRTGTAFVEER